MGAPQARLSELGERLIDLGWEVEALTALPNYPAGRVFPGYPRKAMAETVGRIRAVRVPLLPSQKGFVRRLGCYFSFAGSAAFHGPRLCARPDVLFVESPPLFIGFAARRLARRWRCPYVLNVSDLWPQSAIEMGVVKPGLATRLAERLELSLYRNAAGVTGQSEEIAESVAARSPGTPVEVITNGVEPGRFGQADAEARALIGPEPGPVFLYAGLLGWAQGLDQVLDVAVALPPEVPGRCVLVGEGPVRQALQERIDKEGIDRVRLVPAQPRERIPALLAAADVALATLGLRLQGAVPSKIYEAMASSRPLLLVAEGEAARRVERAGCGLTVRPGDRDGIREAWTRLATDPELRVRLGAAGRRAAETEYDRARIAERLDRFLRRVI
ncbi:MAG TPA: glycosyltransferase family 4 protein [Thermoanaerobaculia bacterium]|nr:glycosyltransferase family 4 protein [Thermoanaerobaculia bacterium]